MRYGKKVGMTLLSAAVIGAFLILDAAGTSAAAAQGDRVAERMEGHASMRMAPEFSAEEAASGEARLPLHTSTRPAPPQIASYPTYEECPPSSSKCPVPRKPPKQEQGQHD